jgi:hypothetical protein
MLKKTKSVREVAGVLEPLGFVYDGRSSNVHQRWRHAKTGRVLITGFGMGDWRGLKNTVRSAKEFLRRIDADTSTKPAPDERRRDLRKGSVQRQEHHR